MKRTSFARLLLGEAGAAALVGYWAVCQAEATGQLWLLWIAAVMAVAATAAGLLSEAA